MCAEAPVPWLCRGGGGKRMNVVPGILASCVVHSFAWLAPSLLRSVLGSHHLGMVYNSPHIHPQRSSSAPQIQAPFQHSQVSSHKVCIFQSHVKPHTEVGDTEQFQCREFKGCPSFPCLRERHAHKVWIFQSYFSECLESPEGTHRGKTAIEWSVD